MMFKSEKFYDYFLCKTCNTLQIISNNNEDNSTYPNDYYSYKKTDNRIKNFLIHQRDSYLMFGKNILGFFIQYFAKGPDIIALASITSDKNAGILDIGCGSGAFIKRLNSLGFNNCVGVDPFIDKDIYDASGKLIVKKDNLYSINEIYDVITFNHSFEHIPDFQGTLLHANKILVEKGVCIIRIPIFPSFAWKKYKENWVQIDAPRHINIFSIQAIAKISEESNFIIEHIYDDSNYFQFLGSEKRNNSVGISKLKLIIDRVYWNIKASKLNRIGQGDQKVFVLRKNN
ncbi:class I SAM-dependent methyltransferase [Polynucleobacter campilacus]|nr:class I SAM-dependent methyltransferase [Polynucleobacter campilacus]